MSVVLISNNPLMASHIPDAAWIAFAEAGPQVVRAVASGQNAPEKTLCVFLDADAKAVARAARDCIHYGWTLLHHPLYGNYRPNQQPYRSLLLAAPSAKTAGPDMASLHLIEEAQLVYNSVNALSPAGAPASLRAACAFLDYELMRLPLEQSGVIPEGHSPSASPEPGEEIFRNRACRPAGPCA